MTAFWAMVRVTIRQLTGRKRTIGFGLLGLVPAGLLFAASRARDLEGLDTDLATLVVTPFLSIIVPLIALILAGSALGDERRDKTLSLLVLRPNSRFSIAGAKLVAASTVSLGFAYFAAVAMALAYVAVGGNLSVLPAILAGTTVASVLYTSLFVVLGTVASRPTLIGLVYILFIENVLAAEIPRLAPVSIWRLGLAAMIDLTPDSFPSRVILGAIGDLAPMASTGLVATGAAVLLAIVACGALLRRSDSV